MLTPLQHELLKIFSRPISDEQMLEIKAHLANYFAQKVDEGVDALFAEKGWDGSQAEAWAAEHNRTSYRHD